MRIIVAGRELKSRREKLHNLRSALYHAQPGRLYKRTRAEVSEGVMYCPDCKRKDKKLVEMEKRRFKKSVKMYVCPVCDWKIPTDNVI